MKKYLKKYSDGKWSGISGRGCRCVDDGRRREKKREEKEKEKREARQ